MYSPLTLISIVCLYVGFLFLIALLVERGRAGVKRIAQSPVVYSLALAVYCTSWTYYGSVGSAANAGMLFLTIYLGPTMMIGLWWFVARKLVRIKTTQRITSIADFISARYGKSQGLAAIATLLALVGTTPYIALQLKAVTRLVRPVRG
jgi:Na+/proline symporter